MAAISAAEPAASPDTLMPTEAPVSSDTSENGPMEQPKREQRSGLVEQAVSAGEADKAATPRPGSQSVAVPSAPTPPPAPRVSDEIMAVLMKRGDQLLAIGDISAARLLYERAASDGSARAMTALGMTYDPNFLSRGNVGGIRPDPAIAARWYAKAAALGDAEAASRIERLQALAPR
jgi:TPR repeat protein